jgi:hypothetical protein
MVSKKNVCHEQQYTENRLQDVLQLQITMANVLIVGITDGADNLVEDMACFVFGEVRFGCPHGGLSLYEIFQQITTFHELEDENHMLL